jgi:thiamine biosynthesis lipoprotein
MGTSYTVQMPGEVSAEKQAKIRAAIERELALVDEQMSTYRDDSELVAWNNVADTMPQKVSPALFGVMKAAVDVGKRSGGAYDITIGPVVNAWGFGPQGFEMEGVDTGHIAALLEMVGFEKLHFDVEAQTVAKERGDLSCDLSSIAKGFAVDQMAASLTKLGVANFWVEVGGEVRGAGTNARGTDWQVGIEFPTYRPGPVKRLVSLKNTSIATSGDYRNYREINGERYSHILDPRTGWPVRHRLASVSVVHPQCMMADAFATALMVMGVEEGLALAEKEGLAAYFLERKDEGFQESASTAFRRLTGMR